MTVAELYEKLSELYPKTLSCSWDNDGIMVSPDTGREVTKILIALDASEAVLNHAAAEGYDTVITHHPMIFRGVKSVTEDMLNGRKILRAIGNGISVLSFHTRLDAAEGGVNDALALALGFSPDGVFGEEDCPTLGRVAHIEPMTAREVAGRLRERLGCTVRLNGSPDAVIHVLGFCGGDGKDLVMPALRMGCDGFITGDGGYNMTQEAAEEGMVTFEIGHYHSEFPVCRALADVVKSITGISPWVMNSCTYTVW